MSKVWKIRLGRQAELDYTEILSWTTKHFGTAQAQTYSETVSQAIQALMDGAQTINVLRLLHESMDLPRHLPKANDFPN